MFYRLFKGKKGESPAPASGKPAPKVSPPDTLDGLPRITGEDLDAREARLAARRGKAK